MKHLKKLAPALIAALLAACASPSPAPVLLTLPSVSSAPAAAASPAPTASAPILAVRRVGIPEYLVARRVRYRADPSTLAEWPNTYWAERIEIGVSRSFVSALRAQLPGWTLCDTSCGDHIPALTLQVEIVPMDYLRSAQKLQAHARITLTDGSATPRVLVTREMPYDLPASADTAQAHAQTIADLVQQVAQVAGPLVKSVQP